MKTISLSKKLSALSGKRSLFLFALAIFFYSCSDNDSSLTTDVEDSQAALYDAQEDYYIDDGDDIALTALGEAESGTESKISTDSRLSCALVTRSGSNSSGSISIDFGAGCTDGRGNIRKGVIVVDYTGRRDIPGSSWRVRFKNYSVNNIEINGTRTVTNISESAEGIQSYDIIMDDGVMTWPDGSIARRRLHHRRDEERDGNILNRLIIYGTAEGNHRNGRGYYIEILEPLVYDRRCDGVIIPVSGKKLIKHGEREITVDYGDGACDNWVTITNKNGRTWRYEVKP